MNFEPKLTLFSKVAAMQWLQFCLLLVIRSQTSHDTNFDYQVDLKPIGSSSLNPFDFRECIQPKFHPDPTPCNWFQMPPPSLCWHRWQHQNLLNRFRTSLAAISQEVTIDDQAQSSFPWTSKIDEFHFGWKFRSCRSWTFAACEIVKTGRSKPVYFFWRPDRDKE